MHPPHHVLKVYEADVLDFFGKSRKYVEGESIYHCLTSAYLRLPSMSLSSSLVLLCIVPHALLHPLPRLIFPKEVSTFSLLNLIA